MKHILLALSFLFSFTASAQIVNIPDPNLKDALVNYERFGEELDFNRDGEIQYSEAEDWDHLSLDNMGISDLTGIEAFVSLTYLQIQYNNLVSVSFAQNILLENLYLGYNNISNIDVTQNINLGHFDCRANSALTSLNLNGNPNLWRLNITQTNITTIDVSQNVNLTELYFHYTPITNIDISSLSSLEMLGFIGCDIEEIDLRFNEVLYWIKFGDNPNLNTIDFSHNYNLNIIYLDDSEFTSLDLSNTPNICFLEIHNNPFLEYINFRNGNNIIYENAWCNGNSSRFDVLDNPNLQFICVDDIQYAIENFDEVPPLVTFVEDCEIAGDINRIKGTITYDSNMNGCDVDDPISPNILVKSTEGINEFATFSKNDGSYKLAVLEGTYITNFAISSPYHEVLPEEHLNTFVGYNQTAIADFCIAPTVTANDLVVTLIPLNDVRPGFEGRYKLIYENVGTTQLSGNVELDFDGALVTFLEATPTETSINGNTISWDFNNLNFFEKRSIEVTFGIAQPPIVEANDILPYTATINPVSGDAAPDDNVFQLNQIVVNSLDPNDKQVLEGGQVLIEDADKYLHYVVRFQNMGTASAINVRVQDALDEKLDWTTLKVLDQSHAMETQVVNGKIDFIFDGINLPTQASDPEGSQGFVAFKVKPLPTIQLDDVVANAADIYFDFNAAIVTNTVYTRFVDELGISDFDTLKIVAYPNPTNNILNIQAEASISSIEIMNVLGQTLLTSKGKSNKEQLDISGLSAGNYFVRVVVGDESQVLRIIVD